MSPVYSQSPSNMIRRIANDLNSSKNPMDLTTFGEKLAEDFFESPEALARYFGQGLSWVNHVKNALVSNRLLSEEAWWKAFPSSASRRRKPMLLRSTQDIIDRLAVNNIDNDNIPTSSKEITQ